MINFLIWKKKKKITKNGIRASTSSSTSYNDLYFLIFISIRNCFSRHNLREFQTIWKGLYWSKHLKPLVPGVH